MIRGYHGKLVDMCGGMIEAQLREIGTLQTWLCDWYHVCKLGWVSQSAED